jgi:hypothetical protein
MSSGLHGNPNRHRASSKQGQALPPLKGHSSWNEWEESETQPGSSTRSLVSHTSSDCDGDGGELGQLKGRALLNMLNGKQSDEALPPPPPPPGPPPKAKLNSRACLFVPKQHLAPPPAPALPSQHSQAAAAKVSVRCVIEGAFAQRLCSITMREMSTHTEVEVVVHPKPTEQYGPWAVDPLAHSRALHLLMQAFKTLGSKAKAIEPSADQTQLHVKYSEVSSDKLCWEFAQYGSCPRPSCRWEHAVLESFVVSIMVQPLAYEFPSQSAMSPTSPQVPVQFGYVIAPAPPTMEQVPGMVYAMPVEQAPMVASFGDVGPTEEACKTTSVCEDESSIVPAKPVFGAPRGDDGALKERIKCPAISWADLEDDD